MDQTISAKGENGTIVVTDYTVSLNRSGLGNKLLGLRGNKEIAIKEITSIQFKEPGMITNGFIQFTFSGSQERKGGTFNAATDENSIVFRKSALRQFVQIKDFINKRRNEIQNQPISAPQIKEDDVYSQIEKLAGLRDKGIVSNDEFEAKKRQLLGI